MSLGSRVFSSVRRVLSDRAFSEEQIEKVLPCIHEEYFKRPQLLAETIDTWNLSMRAGPIREDSEFPGQSIPATASPPPKALVAKQKVNMNTILADVEPRLLMFDSNKLIQRHNSIQGLGLIRNLNEHWIILYNAPRGFYLQDWLDLTKKIYYIDTKVLDLLYDRKELKEMVTHPLVKSAAAVEADFDHIRTRYLFAQRSGFRELSHMHGVQTVLTRPSIKDLILADDDNFLEKFAPFCSNEEYICFANLIKNHEIDEEDADICNRLAELNMLRHLKTEGTGLIHHHHHQQQQQEEEQQQQ